MANAKVIKKKGVLSCYCFTQQKTVTSECSNHVAMFFLNKYLVLQIVKRVKLCILLTELHRGKKPDLIKNQSYHTILPIVFEKQR